MSVLKCYPPPPIFPPLSKCFVYDLYADVPTLKYPGTLTKGLTVFDLEDPSDSFVASFPFLPRLKPAVVETFQTSYFHKK